MNTTRKYLAIFTFVLAVVAIFRAIRARKQPEQPDLFDWYDQLSAEEQAAFVASISDEPYVDRFQAQAQEVKAKVEKAYDSIRILRESGAEYDIAQGYLADIRGTLWTRDGEEITQEQLDKAICLLAQMHQADGMSSWGKVQAKRILQTIPTGVSI